MEFMNLYLSRGRYAVFKNGQTRRRRNFIEMENRSRLFHRQTLLSIKYDQIKSGSWNLWKFPEYTEHNTGIPVTGNEKIEIKGYGAPESCFFFLSFYFYFFACPAKCDKLFIKFVCRSGPRPLVNIPDVRIKSICMPEHSGRGNFLRQLFPTTRYEEISYFA